MQQDGGGYNEKTKTSFIMHVADMYVGGEMFRQRLA
jgi:hypothetical protein